MVDVKTPYISGKVHTLYLDFPFADVIIGNKESIVVPSDAENIPKVKKIRESQ